MNYADWCIKINDLLRAKEEYGASSGELQVPRQQKMPPTKAVAYVIQQREGERAEWQRQRQQ